MRVLEDNYGWGPIDSAPFDKNVTVQDRSPPRASGPGRLGTLQQGNAAGGHAGEVEAVPSHTDALRQRPSPCHDETRRVNRRTASPSRRMISR